jgi:hypothetical protein
VSSCCVLRVHAVIAAEEESNLGESPSGGGGGGGGLGVMGTAWRSHSLSSAG